MIEQLYENNWSEYEDDDYSDNSVGNDIQTHVHHSYMYERKTNLCMINDIKVNSSINGIINIKLSLMNEYGNKIIKCINGDVFFNVYIESFDRNENISIMLHELQCFDNTPQYIDNKYTAMGYSSYPLRLWRLNINRNKIAYINNYCRNTQRKMFINIELNDALPLVQKSLGIYVNIPCTDIKTIPYNQLTKPTEQELMNKTDFLCRKVSIDIEVITPEHWKLFPEATVPGCEIIIIACSFQQNELPYETKILYIDKKGRNLTTKPTDIKREFIMFSDERGMLEYFINMINPLNTDIITGWEVRNFDIKYIYDRCKKFYPALVNNFCKWTLDGSSMIFKNVTRKGQNVTLIDCFGIIFFDMCDYNKSNVKAKSYKLKNIAKMFLQDDRQKLDMDYKNIARYYAHGNDEEFSYLLEYCSVDAEIVLDLMTVQKVWNNTTSMADICHVPLNFVINNGVMQRNVCMISQFINACTDFVLPYKFEREFVEYKGGFVNEPIVGFHSNPVFVLDFNSLYPTTMLAFNICTTTIVNMHDMDTDKKYTLSSEGLFEPNELPELVFKTPTLDVSAVPYMKNVGFVSSANRKGVMPQILDNLLIKRKRIQLECKQTTCMQKRKQLDAQQLSYKLCANAIYGLLGCSFSPLYSPDVAASVTGFGRFLSYIKRKRITQYMQQDGLTGEIIYGDTDSVMIGVKNKSIEEVRNLAIQYAERVTNDIGIHPIKTEYEKIFCPFLIHKKKHYIGVMYTNDCNKYDKIEYKGNEMVRSDNCSLTTSIMGDVINIILFNGGDCIETKCSQISMLLSRILADWSILYMSYNTNTTVERSLLERVIKDAIYSKKLCKEIYKSRLPHVAVYERVKNRKQYHVGDRIVYCIANTEFTDKIKPKNIIEMAYDIDEFLESNNLYLSIHYYLDACIRKPLYRLFATLDKRYKLTLENTFNQLFPPLETSGLSKKRATTTQCPNNKRRKQNTGKLNIFILIRIVCDLFML